MNVRPSPSEGDCWSLRRFDRDCYGYRTDIFSIAYGCSSLTGVDAICSKLLSPCYPESFGIAGWVWGMAGEIQASRQRVGKIGLREVRSLQTNTQIFDGGPGSVPGFGARGAPAPASRIYHVPHRKRTAPPLHYRQTRRPLDPRRRRVRRHWLC